MGMPGELLGNAGYGTGVKYLTPHSPTPSACYKGGIVFYIREWDLGRGCVLSTGCVLYTG